MTESELAANLEIRTKPSDLEVILQDAKCNSKWAFWAISDAVKYMSWEVLVDYGTARQHLRYARTWVANLEKTIAHLEAMMSNQEQEKGA